MGQKQGDYRCLPRVLIWHLTWLGLTYLIWLGLFFGYHLIIIILFTRWAAERGAVVHKVRPNGGGPRPDRQQPRPGTSGANNGRQ